MSRGHEYCDAEIAELEHKLDSAERAIERLAGDYTPMMRGCNCSFCSYLRGIKLRLNPDSLPASARGDTGPVAGREKPNGEPANAADAKADRLSVSNNRQCND